VLRLPSGAALTGARLAEWLDGGLPDAPGIAGLRYERYSVHVCGTEFIQTGRFRGEQLLAGLRVPVTGRWQARWERLESPGGRAGWAAATPQGRWVIAEAVLRPSLSQVLRPAFRLDCTGPWERSAAQHGTSVTVHAGALARRGGPGRGMEAELLYAGWDGSALESETDVRVGLSHRLRGAWGGRLLAGSRTALAMGTPAGLSGSDGPSELRFVMSYGALMAMYERGLLRAAAGPAVARSTWTWSGPESPPASSELVPGWVNEVALVLPVGRWLFLDIAYHDWLFGGSTPPAYLDVEPPEQRLRGASVSVGVGGRF
jgi:hypothetical protein